MGLPSMEANVFRSSAFHFIVPELIHLKALWFQKITRGALSPCHVWNLVSVKWLHSVKQITGRSPNSWRCKSLIPLSKSLMTAMIAFFYLRKNDKGLQLTSDKCYGYNRCCFHHEERKGFINRFKGSFLKPNLGWSLTGRNKYTDPS